MEHNVTCGWFFGPEGVVDITPLYHLHTHHASHLTSLNNLSCTLQLEVNFCFDNLEKLNIHIYRHTAHLFLLVQLAMQPRWLKAQCQEESGFAGRSKLTRSPTHGSPLSLTGEPSAPCFVNLVSRPLILCLLTVSQICHGHRFTDNIYMINSVGQF